MVRYRRPALFASEVLSMQICMQVWYCSVCIFSPCDLLIRHELHCLIGDDPDTVGAIALKHTPHAFLLIHIFAPLSKTFASAGILSHVNQSGAEVTRARHSSCCCSMPHLPHSSVQSFRALDLHQYLQTLQWGNSCAGPASSSFPT